jgi:hypothetical protein
VHHAVTAGALPDSWLLRWNRTRFCRLQLLNQSQFVFQAQYPGFTFDSIGDISTDFHKAGFIEVQKNDSELFIGNVLNLAKD